MNTFFYYDHLQLRHLMEGVICLLDLLNVALATKFVVAGLLVALKRLEHGMTVPRHSATCTQSFQ